MRDYIEERAVEIANYIIENRATVRQAAKKFGISKSTVHKDCSQRICLINPSLAADVRKVLDVNKAERISVEEWRPVRNICIWKGIRKGERMLSVLYITF